MLSNTPERLSRWMLLHEQPERLPLEHEAQADLAWAADEIATLKGREETLETEKSALTQVVADFLKLHYREMEGLTCGMPTPGEWTEAVTAAEQVMNTLEI